MARRARPPRSTRGSGRAGRRGRAAQPSTPSGVHFLRSSAVARATVSAAEVDPEALVVDLGAGEGALTNVLARTGARVLAVERDPSFVRRLQRRFTDAPTVRVVESDMRTVPLPRRPFTVVANLPFAVSTAMLRRLLGADRRSFAAANLLLEWGFAKRVTTPSPRDLETAWWAARFDLTLVNRVSAHVFAPRPAVDAAHLSIRRAGGLDAACERALWTVLTACYSAPTEPAARAAKAIGTGRRTNRLLSASGINPATPAIEVPVERWRQVVRAVRGRP